MTRVRAARWTVLLSLLHLATSAVLTITRNNGQSINDTDVQEIGRPAVYSCPSVLAQWYYLNNTLVSTDRSQNPSQMARLGNNDVLLRFDPFSASLQGYYVCRVANTALRDSFGVFVSSNLHPVNLNVAASEDMVRFSWQTETGPEPIARFAVLMGEVQQVVGSHWPSAMVRHRDLLQGQQTRLVTFSVTSVIAGREYQSEISAVIVSGPNWISAQAINTSSILVDWDPLVINPPAVTDITGYMVEYKRTSDTIYQSHGPVEHSPALITGLSSNTLYTFRVVPIARSNMPSDIVGPFPSSLRAASTPATTDPPTQFPRQPERGSYQGAVIGAVVVSLLIFGVAVAIGVVALLLIARRQRRTRLVIATVSSFRRSPSQDSNMAVKHRPQSSYVDGAGNKPHRLKSFVQKKSSFIIPRKTCQSLNYSRRESETKDVVGYEGFVETVPPIGGDKEKKLRKDYANIALQPPDEDPTYCVNIQSFPDYVKGMHQQREKGFEKEYDDLCRETEYLPHSTIIARNNRVRNRFNNIFTFDHTRVVLYAPDKDGSDYINASFIDGHSRPKAYISSQGPTPETIPDFWQMIWDQKSPVIVMLTRVEEKGRKKCERYWLQECSVPYEMGRELSVTLEEFKLYADCEVREFTVKKLDQPLSPPHSVTHFLFTGWPDHGVPQHPSSLLRFTQKVRAVYNAHQAPMVVHCSAGVGRSGTFITIDAQIQRLKDLNNVNIYHFVREMRNCRTHMVQTLDQYVFIHDAIFDHIVCGDTSIAASSLKSKLPELTSVDPKTGISELHTEYELLNSVCMGTTEDDRKFFSKPLVSSKNRYPDKYPYSQKYLYLLGRSATKGSEYINASFVNSYLSDNDYIAAQTPMENTVDDVWQVIWQFRCGIVVTLGECEEDREEMCYQFWPETAGQYLHITVETSSVEKKKDYTVYKHQVHDGMKQSVPLEVTHFHYRSWPSQGQPNMTTLLQMMVESMKVKKAARRPKFVMCSDGMNRTGTYICIASEIEHIRLEGSLDVFQSVKLARCQRPHLVSTEENYAFCYQTLQAYVESFDDYANFKDLS